MSWTTASIPPQNGKLAVVTGASGGLGLQTASALAAKGAEVIVAARDPQKAASALAKIGANARFEPLDLADLASVRDCARRLIDQGRPIDLLINNAGLASPPKRLTTHDGFELQFGTNFLGHFLLDALLLPLVRQARSPRVVTVSSIMHKYGRIDFDDLMSERRYSPVSSYSQSKLANLVFARELQRRSDAGEWGVMSVAAHPGIARTELTKARPGQPVLAMNRVGDLFAPLFTGTALNGALPTLFAATSPEAAPGGPTGILEIKGPPGPARSTSESQDPAVASRLWTEAERLTGVRF